MNKRTVMVNEGPNAATWTVGALGQMGATFDPLTTAHGTRRAVLAWARAVYPNHEIDVIKAQRHDQS